MNEVVNTPDRPAGAPLETTGNGPCAAGSDVFCETHAGGSREAGSDVVCEISSDPQRLQPDRIRALLAETYWAGSRDAETIDRSIAGSLCFGAYVAGSQVGFARVITDYATTYYLCDVVVDPSFRGRSIGKQLVQAVVSDPRLSSLLGILATRDAHGLYEAFGFQKGGDRFMARSGQ